MRKIVLCVALLLVAFGCGDDKACREGTISIVMNFVDPPSRVDGVALRYQLDSEPIAELRPVVRPAGANSGTMALALKAYASHRQLLLYYAPRRGETIVGAWQQRLIVLDEGCTALRVTLDVGADGGSVDAPLGVDVSVDASPRVDRQVEDGGDSGSRDAQHGDSAERDAPLLPDAMSADGVRQPDGWDTGDAWRAVDRPDDPGASSDEAGRAGIDSATDTGAAMETGGIHDSGGPTETGAAMDGGPCPGIAPDNYGAWCGSCGGQIQCDGTCSVPTPSFYGDVCSACGGRRTCSGACSMSDPADYGKPCGSCGGTIKCDGTCSVGTPSGYGTICSGPFDCGRVGWSGCTILFAMGTIQCNGACGNITATSNDCLNYCYHPGP